VAFVKVKASAVNLCKCGHLQFEHFFKGGMCNFCSETCPKFIKKTQPKYHNEKVVVGDHKFDSKKEAKRYHELLILQRAGEISELDCQVKFQITVQMIKICAYVADFTYYDKTNRFVVEDTKGMKTRIYRLKKKLMLATHNINIRET